MDSFARLSVVIISLTCFLKNIKFKDLVKETAKYIETVTLLSFIHNFFVHDRPNPAHGIFSKKSIKDRMKSI